ncbi:hypothetical protein IV102_07885 [bacterium]|nr:hypothetical protein [bacterium]
MIIQKRAIALPPPVRRPLLSDTTGVDRVSVSGSGESKLQVMARHLGKGAIGGALGAVPAAAAGYAISAWGGVPGGILGGVLGASLGYLSGREAYQAARKLASSDPEKMSRTQKTAFKLGSAAPYAWALLAGASGALAGSTFHPGVTAVLMARRGMIAGALLMGTSR